MVDWVLLSVLWLQKWVLLRAGFEKKPLCSRVLRRIFKGSSKLTTKESVRVFFQSNKVKLYKLKVFKVESILQRFLKGSSEN